MTITRAQFLKAILGVIAAALGVKKATAGTAIPLRQPGASAVLRGITVRDGVITQLHKDAHIQSVRIMTSEDMPQNEIMMISTPSGGSSDWVRQRFVHCADLRAGDRLTREMGEKALANMETYEDAAFYGNGPAITLTVNGQPVTNPILHEGDRINLDFDSVVNPGSQAFLYNVKLPPELT